MIYIATDHAGFDLKNELVSYLKEKDIEVTDLGANELEPEDDYTDYATKLATAMNKDKDMGIIICGSGQGVCMAINKYKGIRGAQAWSIETAKTARNDDNANVLCLAGRVYNIDNPKEIVTTFIETNFESAKRRERRLAKLKDIEKSN